MKRIFIVLSLIVLCGYQLAYANISADDIIELNNATPGTFKVGLGTVLSAEQANIDTNTTKGATNATAIDALEAFTSDVKDVAFLTTDDTSLTLTNVAYVRKYTGSKNEGLKLGAGIAQQVVTFSLAVYGGGNFDITPDTSSGFSEVKLQAAGHNITLKYISTSIGWVLVGEAWPDTLTVIPPVNPFN